MDVDLPPGFETWRARSSEWQRRAKSQRERIDAASEAFLDCCRRLDVEEATVLLRSEGGVVLTRDPVSRETGLHLVCDHSMRIQEKESQNPLWMLLLLLGAGADVNAVDRFGRTVLFNCVSVDKSLLSRVEEPSLAALENEELKQGGEVISRDESRWVGSEWTDLLPFDAGSCRAIVSALLDAGCDAETQDYSGLSVRRWLKDQMLMVSSKLRVEMGRDEQRMLRALVAHLAALDHMLCGVSVDGSPRRLELEARSRRHGRPPGIVPRPLQYLLDTVDEEDEESLEVEEVPVAKVLPPGIPSMTDISAVLLSMKRLRSIRSITDQSTTSASSSSSSSTHKKYSTTTTSSSFPKKHRRRSSSSSMAEEEEEHVQSITEHDIHLQRSVQFSTPPNTSNPSMSSPNLVQRQNTRHTPRAPANLYAAASFAAVAHRIHAIKESQRKSSSRLKSAALAVLASKRLQPSSSFPTSPLKKDLDEEKEQDVPPGLEGFRDGRFGVAVSAIQAANRWKSKLPKPKSASFAGAAATIQAANRLKTNPKKPNLQKPNFTSFAKVATTIRAANRFKTNLSKTSSPTSMAALATAVQAAKHLQKSQELSTTKSAPDLHQQSSSQSPQKLSLRAAATVARIAVSTTKSDKKQPFSLSDIAATARIAKHLQRGDIDSLAAIPDSTPPPQPPPIPQTPEKLLPQKQSPPPPPPPQPPQNNTPRPASPPKPPPTQPPSSSQPTQQLQAAHETPAPKSCCTIA